MVAHCAILLPPVAAGLRSMDSSRTLAHALTLLSGELRDSSGEVLTPAAHPVVAVQGDSDARAALAEGRRVALAVPLASGGGMTRLPGLCLARVRLGSARRRLAAAGASRVRAFAMVTAGEALFLAYELGETIQPYVEDYIVLEPPGSGPARAARRALRTLSGLPTTVDLVVVVGEPA